MFILFGFSMNTCFPISPNNSYSNNEHGYLPSRFPFGANQRQFLKSWSYDVYDISETLMDSDEPCTMSQPTSICSDSEYFFDRNNPLDGSLQSSQGMDACLGLDLESHLHESGQVQLWQFLLELLMNAKFVNVIRWTHDNEYEFVIIQADNVAKLWGIQTKKPNMTFEKFSRGLR
jgi:hypothetical protein